MILLIGIMKRFTNFSFLFLILVLFCFHVQACHSSSTIAIKDQASHTKASVESDKSLDPAVDLFSLKLKFQDNVVRAGLLYDLVSDTIFWEKNMHEAYPIASLTKMMVGLLVVEDIYAGKITWNSMIRVTPEATRTGGFRVSLRSGSSFSVEDLLKATLISSGNDAAYLLAQFLGGTEKKFVTRMNQRARQLGMKSTRFSNSTGMPAPNRKNDNHSSPSDLLILSKEMLKYDELLWIARTSESSISEGGKTIKLRNQNRLVASFDEVDGFKTGFTLNAKYCLAATANKNGRRIIAIALGFDSQDQRNQFVGNMLSQCYDTMGMGSLQPKTLITMVSSSKTTRPDPPAPIFHRVRRGDNLYSIAKANSCSIAQLKSWNHLKGNVIKPGQKLKLYPKSRTIYASASQPASSKVIYYKVQPGDTLWRISQKYKGISVQKLMHINGIKRAADLKAGDTIKIVVNIG
jgi:serine-type D-Ala-D-Ala carboxypeptidase (penicillin-binding protein 5/6)